MQPNTNKPLQADNGSDARGKSAADMQHARSASDLIASGDCAVVSGGYNDSSTGDYASSGGGRGTRVTGGYASCPVGRQNRVAGENATALGAYASAPRYGQMAMAAGGFATHGDAQGSFLIARNDKTADLYLDGASELLVIPSGKTWALSGLLVARRTDADNESAGWEFKSVIDNFSGAVTLVGTPTATSIGDYSGGTWAFAVSADDTNSTL